MLVYHRVYWDSEFPSSSFQQQTSFLQHLESEWKKHDFVRQWDSMGYFLGGNLWENQWESRWDIFGIFLLDNIIYSMGKPMGFYEFGTWLSLRGRCQSCMQFLGCDVACWPNGAYNMNPQRTIDIVHKGRTFPKGPVPSFHAILGQILF